MQRRSSMAIALVSVLTATACAVWAAPAFARHKVHKHHAARAATGVLQGDSSGDPRGTQPADGQPVDGPLPGPQGPFAGAGGVFSPEYEAPGGEVYHLGGQLLGGEFGKAYEDYYRHYYYYKYSYCPLGTSYVIYLRRCVGPFDLFR